MFVCERLRRRIPTSACRLPRIILRYVTTHNIAHKGTATASEKMPCNGPEDLNLAKHMMRAALRYKRISLSTSASLAAHLNIA